MGVLCLSLFWYALLCVLSSFTIILKRKRELVALLILSYGCLVTVNQASKYLKIGTCPASQNLLTFMGKI